MCPRDGLHLPTVATPVNMTGSWGSWSENEVPGLADVINQIHTALAEDRKLAVHIPAEAEVNTMTQNKKKNCI